MNKEEQKINKLRKRFVETQEKAFSIQHDLLMNPEKRAVGLGWIKEQTKDNNMGELITSQFIINDDEEAGFDCGWIWGIAKCKRCNYEIKFQQCGIIVRGQPTFWERAESDMRNHLLDHKSGLVDWLEKNPVKIEK